MPLVRPFAPADAPGVEMVMRRSLALGGPAGVTLAEHVRGLDALLAHPEEAAVAVEGEVVVGYTHPMSARLEVDPPYRRRGHGRRLLGAARRLAADAGDDQLELWVPAEGPGRAFAKAVGMHHRSSFHLLRLPPEVVVPGPVSIADIAVRTMDPGADDAAVVALLNEAFADHPSPMRFSLNQIAAAHARPDFDPADVRLAHEAVGPHRLVAFCRSTVGPAADVPRRGEVRLVGVLPAYRRRGIGRELLRWGIAHVRSRGAAEVDLVVEALNAGALQLYRDEGFAHVAEWPRWVIPSASIVAP